MYDTFQLRWETSKGLRLPLPSQLVWRTISIPIRNAYKEGQSKSFTEIILCVRTTFLYHFTVSLAIQLYLPSTNINLAVQPQSHQKEFLVKRLLNCAMPLSWHEGKDCKCVACRCFWFVSVCVCRHHAEIFKRIVRDLYRHTQWNKRNERFVFFFPFLFVVENNILQCTFLYILFGSQLYAICVCVCVCTFTPFH